jgi:hypothetical protein
MKEELYRKVYIKTEADLPKEKDEYFCHRKSDNRLLIFNRFSDSDREFENSVWLRNVDYYLQPIVGEQTEQKERMSAAQYYCRRFGFPYAVMDEDSPHCLNRNGDVTLKLNTILEILEEYSQQPQEQKQPSDEEIEKWAGQLPYRSKLNHEGRIEGAKAVRDKLIKTK